MQGDLFEPLHPCQIRIPTKKINLNMSREKNFPSYTVVGFFWYIFIYKIQMQATYAQNTLLIYFFKVLNKICVKTFPIVK